MIRIIQALSLLRESTVYSSSWFFRALPNGISSRTLIAVDAKPYVDPRSIPWSIQSLLGAAVRFRLGRRRKQFSKLFLRCVSVWTTPRQRLFAKQPLLGICLEDARLRASFSFMGVWWGRAVHLPTIGVRTLGWCLYFCFSFLTQVPYIHHYLASRVFAEEILSLALCYMCSCDKGANSQTFFDSFLYKKALRGDPRHVQISREWLD